MSNSDPSAIVLHCIRGMRGIIHVSIRMEKTVRSRFAAIHLPGCACAECSPFNRSFTTLARSGRLLSTAWYSAAAS